MKRFALSALAAAALAALASPGAARADGEEAVPQEYYGRIARRVAGMLPRYHVLQRQLDDEISRRAWTNIVTYYDFDHSVFLKGDLDRLAAHETTIDDELKEGDVSFGYEIYSLYCERLRERLLFATNLLAEAKWDFSVDEGYRIRRKDAPWPETKEEAEDHWRRRMKNEVLAQTLAREIDAEEAAAKKKEAKAEEKADAEGSEEAAGRGLPALPDGTEAAETAGRGLPALPGGTEDAKSEAPTIEQNLIKKYRQYGIALCEPDEESVLQHYLSAVCRAYDPHTDYLSPMAKDDFDMEMNLTLCGVGAVLSMDDGALKIAEVMPGGPIDVDGRIKAGDKIVGVKQEDGEMEDVMWQPMRKSIRKIRGKKGTKVTLDVIPRKDPTGATHRLIELVRDEIKLDEQAATGRVETVEMDGSRVDVGYVYLPSFYGTLDKRPGDEGFLSCAADVGRYVAEFNAAGVGGMILDLRGDGGGSLKEAVALSSLFVASGPVVLIRDNHAAMPLEIQRGNPVAFRKPLVVLVDRVSASASEIVAGHLKDVGRAVVLGDRTTHGKGTVQSVLGLGPEKYGSMKITTARFYRVNGMSTQVEGVPADIRLPSFLDTLDIGEDKLPNALPFTKIRGANFRRCWNLDTYAEKLGELSRSRTESDPAFVRHVRNVEASKAIFEREEVPLERAARKALMLADREVRDRDPDDIDEVGEIGAELGLDSVSEEDGDDADGGGEAAEGKDGEGDGDGAPARPRRRKAPDPKDDIVLQEALKVTADLIRLNGGMELPADAYDWYNAIFGF